MTHETVARARDILEIFAEAQAIVADKTAVREAALEHVIRAKKAADNADQYKNRRCNREKREARNAARNARRGAPIKPRCKSEEERVARRRARQREWARRNRKAAA